MSKNISIKNDKNNIILIGYMGSGKSHIGQMLSYRLAMNYIDTDQLIEEKQGKPIAAIFKDKGEKHFRILEHKLLLSLAGTTNTVISTGGGMPVHNNNMALLTELGRTFYLKVGVDKLIERLTQSNDRPLINQLKSNGQIRQFVKGNLKARLPYYGLADHTVMASRSGDKVVERIVGLL